MSEKRVAKCESCGKEFEYEVFMWQGKEILPPKRCDECCEREEQMETARKRTEMAHEAFFEVCPPLYRQTDIKRLPAALQRLCVTWQYGPEGVGIIGLPGKCKTRAGILILKRMAEEGRTVGFVTATKFSEMTVDQFSTDEDFREDARNQLRDLRNVDVLLFDDLGKGKITERAEVELYSLLEERTSHMLPTIWTANSQLKSMFGNMSDERSGAILRRLTEFSAIHTV